MLDYEYENGYCVRDAFKQAGIPIDIKDKSIPMDDVDVLLEQNGYTIYDKPRQNLHLLDLTDKEFFIQFSWKNGYGHIEY